MGKGEHTKQAILDEAVALASEIGVGGLTIGALAERCGLSKSGLFAHFGAKEELQLEVIREAQERFVDVVFRPAVKKGRGLPRLRQLFLNWLRWTRQLRLPGGCVLAAAATEFDDQPGAVRDAIVQGQAAWRNTVIEAIRLAVAEGHLDSNVDAPQLAFELLGIVLAAQFDKGLFKDDFAEDRAMKAFDRLVQHA